MTTRRGRNATARMDDITPVEVDDRRQDTREDFARMEERLLHKVANLAMDPSRIRAIAEDALSDTVIRIEESLRQLAQGQERLREKLEASTLEPGREDGPSLRDELNTLRNQADDEYRKLWAAIDTLKGKKPRASDEPDEPIMVRDSEYAVGHDVIPPSRPRRRKESTRSRKRREGKSRSSKHTRRQRYSIESDSDSLSSSDESIADLDDHEDDEIRVADKDCRKVLNVETYRLIDRDPERDVALKTAKVLTNLRHLFDGERFDGTDPLTVLPFLEELKTTFDDASLSEGDAKYMIRYFLTGEAARSFKGLAPRDKKSYPRIVKWLLRTYVREHMLQDARQEFLTRAQRPTETELEYSRALSELAKKCAGMIPARDLINRFVRGLRPAIRTQVQGRVARSTSWAVAVAIATEHGNAHREAKKENEARREPRYTSLPRRKDPQGRGRTLLVQHPVEDGSSDDGIIHAHNEDRDIFEVRDTDLIGAIRQGPALMQREASYTSLPTSVGSSGERYYTPPPSLPERETRNRPFTAAAKRVTLAPGVPYPAKQTQSPRQTSAVGALPCLGCGRTGHWLSECPGVNPRLKDLALEALRARKQARQVRIDERRDPSPGKFRNVLPVKEDEIESAPAEVQERDEPADNVG